MAYTVEKTSDLPTCPMARAEPGADPRPRALARRQALRGLLAAVAAPALAAPTIATPAIAVPALAKPAIVRPLPDATRAWGLFKERFVKCGRVIDNGNGGVSHSEGQGVALLAAVQSGDRQSFDELYHWTRATLRRPYDSLHAWRYKPDATCHVDDPNNATDGDLLITLALFAAAARWEVKPFRDAAMALTRDIRSALVRETQHGLVLLPGISGFTERTGVVINPSYYVLPAIQRMKLEMPDPAWDRLVDDGLALLRAGRFGHWRLPPDWLSVNAGEALGPANKWPPRFSFDAVRLPLYMCWAGMSQDPIVASVHAFWSSYGPQAAPAWTDLKTGGAAPYAQCAGMTAIRDYVEAARRGSAAELDLSAASSAMDYYQAALGMLVTIASSSGSAPV